MADFKLDARKIPDGAVLIVGVTYPDNPKTYTYALLKAGGYWYGTGSGKVPTMAGWGAIERWFTKDGKTVVWVKAVTATEDLWPVSPSPVDTSQLSE